jgi:hypothetical protein
MKRFLALASLLSVLGVSVAQTADQPGITVTPYGLAMYRFRVEYKMKTTDGQPDSALFDYLNTVAYKLGSKVKVNDEVSFQLEIANDWNSTEVINLVAGNFMARRNANIYPYFTLGFVTWDPGYMHISAGVVPVQNSATTALLGMSLFYGKTYKKAGHIPWATATNGGIPGFRIGAPLVKGDFTLGADLLTSIVEERGATYIAADAPSTARYGALMLNLDIPMAMKEVGLTITPQVFVIPNRNCTNNGDDMKTDMEIIAGADVGYKVNEIVVLRGGAGYGMLSNKNTFTPADPEYDRSGVHGYVGTTAKLGPGKLDVDVNVSTSADAKNDAQDATYPFVDVKYGAALNKNFVVMPRIRLFMTSTETVLENHMRPELIFTGAF